MPSELEYFLEDIPTWPLKDKATGVSSPYRWIRKLGDILVGRRLRLKLLVVEKKTTGKMAIWVERWRTSRTEAECEWSQFVIDFIHEASLDRETSLVTWDEVTGIKQGEFESTIDYILRMTLTMQLMPDELGDDPPFSPNNERVASHFFCKGLRSNHPFKLNQQAAPQTLENAYEAVLKFTKLNREDQENEESRLIERRIVEEAVPTTEIVVEEAVPTTEIVVKEAPAVVIVSQWDRF